MEIDIDNIFVKKINKIKGNSIVWMDDMVSVRYNVVWLMPIIYT